MNNYSVPKVIQSLKPKSIPCFVKAISTLSKAGVSTVHYYVYERVSVEDKKHPGKKKGTSGSCIGKIVGNTFYPNKVGLEKLGGSMSASESHASESDAKPKSSVQEQKLQEIANNMNLNMKDLDLQLKNYGEYAMVLACSDSVLRKLTKTFSSSDAAMIYVLSIIYFIEEYTPASYLKNIYDQSILSNYWPSLAISENKIGEFLEQLGLHPALCDKYSQSLIDDSSGLTAIDGHVILTCSRINDLADYGNKYQKLGNKQMNVLQAYDAEKKTPLTSKAYDGALLDKMSVEDLLSLHSFPQKTVFLIDMGFYSEKDLGLYREGGKHFVIPLPDHTELSKALQTDISFTDAFLYEKNGENKQKIQGQILYRETTVKEMEKLAYDMRKAEADKKNKEEADKTPADQKPKKHYPRKQSESLYSEDRLIMYRDVLMHDALVNEFREQIGSDSEHTEERLLKLEPTFGLIILRTNLEKNTYSPSVVYGNYKKRWTIETHYNFVENTIKFTGLQTENYSVMQGLAFLMIPVGQIKASFVRKLRESSSSYVSNMSIHEALVKARYFKLSQRQDNTWHTTTATKKQMELLVNMGVDIAADIKKFNDGVF